MATPTTLPSTFVAGNVLTAAQMNDLRGAFRVLQVVQTVKTDTYSLTSTTFTDVTGVTATITPSSTSSKILVCLSCSARMGTATAQLKLVRGSTDICLGDASGNRARTSISQYTVSTSATLNLDFLDSPATTSATTYKVQVRGINSAAAAIGIQIGSSSDGGDRTDVGVFPTVLTLYEVSA